MSTITIPEHINSPGGATAGIRLWVTFEEFGPLIPQLSDEVVAWVEAQGGEPVGPFYIRYHVIAMPVRMEVEVGIFVKRGISSADDRVTVGEMPAGRYLNTRYTGHYDGLMDATACVVGFAKQNDIKWDSWDTPEGEAFASRFELYITDPGDNPDPDTWITDIAIKVAD